jgi:archaellum component FlaC
MKMMTASVHLGNAEYLATVNTGGLRAQRLLVDSERMSQVEQDVASLKEDVGGLKRSVARLESNVARLESNVADINDKLDRLLEVRNVRPRRADHAASPV